MPIKKYQNKRKGDRAEGVKERREIFLFEPKTFFIIIITSILTLLIAFFGEQGAKFFTSVLSPVPEHAPFNGTTLPVKQVPNWIKLTDTERTLAYAAILADKLMAIPSYNPAHLAIPASTLKWNDSTDDAIRNEKITYPTPYLGSYELNGIESAGSHPAVDIKVPMGTPVYAIANGTVIKAEYSNGGFGNNIVIQHNNVPSPEDPKVTTTIFSGYAHLSSISVKVNDVVTKGQLIGASGMSGTATTPHVHFQIDNANAPWHLYWPFTSADMKNSGYTFFQAINNGLGQNNAALYTINPLKYVQKYYGEQTLVASAAPEVIKPPTPADDADSVSFVVQTAGGTKFDEGGSVQFVIQAFDAKGNLLRKPTFKDVIQLSLLNGKGKLNRTKLQPVSLRTGVSSIVRMADTRPGKEKLVLRFRDREFSSQEFEIAPRATAVARFFVFVDKTEVKTGETVTLTLKAYDDNGNVVSRPLFTQSPTVELTDPRGTVNPHELSADLFASGEAHAVFMAQTPGILRVYANDRGHVFDSPVITITPADSAPQTPPQDSPTPQSEAVNQASQTSVLTADFSPAPAPVTTPAEALTSAAPAQPASPPAAQTPPNPPLPFTDIPADSQYYAALSSLKSLGLVAGYPDGSFQPEKHVSRAEAVALVLRVLDEKLHENATQNFPDVSADAWYGKFIATAFELGFIKGYPDGVFRPSNEVNLPEFLTMLFVGAKMDIDPQIADTLPSGISSSDWFAPVIQEALTEKIIEVRDNTLHPEQPLTRGEVAEILYHFLQSASA